MGGGAAAVWIISRCPAQDNVLHPGVMHEEPAGRDPLLPIRCRSRMTYASDRLDQKETSLTGQCGMILAVTPPLVLQGLTHHKQCCPITNPHSRARHTCSWLLATVALHTLRGHKRFTWRGDALVTCLLHSEHLAQWLTSALRRRGFHRCYCCCS